MVPGSLGCVSAVLAAITTLAPSRAAFSAMALPMPRLAPVMNRVEPDSFLEQCTGPGGGRGEKRNLKIRKKEMTETKLTTRYCIQNIH